MTYISYFREGKLKQFDKMSSSEKKKILSKIPNNPKDFKIWAYDVQKHTTPDGQEAKFITNKYKEWDLMYDGLFDSDDSGFVYVLKYINPFDVELGETWQSEDEVLNMPSTKQYINWLEKGYEPSPITVIYNKKNNKFISLNRRRLLSARQVNSKIPAFIEIGKYEDLLKQKLLIN